MEAAAKQIGDEDSRRAIEELAKEIDKLTTLVTRLSALAKAGLDRLTAGVDVRDLLALLQADAAVHLQDRAELHRQVLHHGLRHRELRQQIVWLVLVINLLLGIVFICLLL